LKFFIGPGWAKKVEIFDESGVVPKKLKFLMGPGWAKKLKFLMAPE
jgi:hypothetical protein